MSYLCQVANCSALATSSIEDFLVCDLHDHPNVQKILERLERPGHYSTFQNDLPIVIPCGPLLEEHLVPRPPVAWVRPPVPRPRGRNPYVHSDFDLGAA